MKKIKSLACAAIIGLTFTSCDDFLTLLPLNEVVLENFWTDKSDVESVLLGTYEALETQDCIFRMSMWGEMRSDNIKAGANNPPEDILNITKDNIMETNPYASWACFYNVINRANTVLAFAPEVAEKDPNYTPAELSANEAEAIALRSLCYWYLIRAYRDVPFVTRPSIDDTEDFLVPASKFDDILDQLISDLEEVKDHAVNRYVKTLGFTSEAVTASRITRAGIYAMLADMYLWKGDWQKSIDCAQFVINRKLKEYNDIYNDETEGGTRCIIKLYNGIPLISEIGAAETASGNYGGTAYDETFGTGYGFENLFELSFEQDKTKNDFVTSNYLSVNQNRVQLGRLAPTSDLTITPDASGTNKLFSFYDGRFYESIYRASTSSTDYGIGKFALSSVQYEIVGGNINWDYSLRSSNPPHWIIYRFTDVLLMMSEALVMQASEYSDAVSADSINTRDSLLNAAFNNVLAVNNRATIFKPISSALKFNDYKTVEKMDKLVLDERQRELLFEGKRWFDLVRRARRIGNTSEIAKYVQPKHTGSNSTFATKIKDMDYIYFPIHEGELKINTKLKQNPAFVLDEFIEKN